LWRKQGYFVKIHIKPILTAGIASILFMVCSFFLETERGHYGYLYLKDDGTIGKSHLLSLFNEGFSITKAEVIDCDGEPLFLFPT